MEAEKAKLTCPQLYYYIVGGSGSARTRFTTRFWTLLDKFGCWPLELSSSSRTVRSPPRAAIMSGESPARLSAPFHLLSPLLVSSCMDTERKKKKK